MATVTLTVDFPNGRAEEFYPVFTNYVREQDVGVGPMGGSLTVYTTTDDLDTVSNAVTAFFEENPEAAR